DHACVAQWTRATRFEREGWGFESLRMRHIYTVNAEAFVTILLESQLDDELEKVALDAHADPSIQDFHVYSYRDRWIEIKSIRIKPEHRSKGKGSFYVQRVNEIADRFGIPVLLTPQAESRRKGDLE